MDFNLLLLSLLQQPHRRLISMQKSTNWRFCHSTDDGNRILEFLNVEDNKQTNRSYSNARHTFLFLPLIILAIVQQPEQRIHKHTVVSCKILEVQQVLVLAKVYLQYNGCQNHGDVQKERQEPIMGSKCQEKLQKKETDTCIITTRG